MKCSTSRVEIVAALQDASTLVPREELQDHLAECRACREFEADQRELSELLAGATPVEMAPPASLWNGIEERLLADQASAATTSVHGNFWDFLSWPQLNYAALALCLLMVTGWLAIETDYDVPLNQSALQELDEYELIVTHENPFVRVNPEGNPFFAIRAKEFRNPFRTGGESQ